MKAQTQFNILIAGRKSSSQAAAESKQYIVMPITKKGEFSKATPDTINCCDSLEDAMIRLSAMRMMNPGKSYGIQHNV